jgi:cysteinyl-tRNA synthetase
LYNFDAVLGLNLEKWEEATVEITPELQALLEERQAARLAKDWAAADAARDKILALGFKVEDKADGQKLRKA